MRWLSSCSIHLDEGERTAIGDGFSLVLPRVVAGLSLNPGDDGLGDLADAEARHDRVEGLLHLLVEPRGHDPGPEDLEGAVVAGLGKGADAVPVDGEARLAQDHVVVLDNPVARGAIADLPDLEVLDEPLALERQRLQHLLLEVGLLQVRELALELGVDEEGRGVALAVVVRPDGAGGAVEVDGGPGDDPQVRNDEAHRLRLVAQLELSEVGVGGQGVGLDDELPAARRLLSRSLLREAQAHERLLRLLEALGRGRERGCRRQQRAHTDAGGAAQQLTSTNSRRRGLLAGHGRRAMSGAARRLSAAGRPCDGGAGRGRGRRVASSWLSLSTEAAGLDEEAASLGDDGGAGFVEVLSLAGATAGTLALARRVAH
mmetsp:Transcript_65143/g.170601  ORF Transcript_65143/g.170601 Transcript_65143/m.170601 type:complete len:373 (-) Transcript_65143:60-1178(-)